MFQNVDLAQQSADQDPQSLSDEKIKEVLEAEPLITEFLKQVNKEAMRRFDTGHMIPGLKVVYSGRGKSGWVEDSALVEKVLKGFKIPKAQMFNTTMKTPTQIKKLTWENTKGEKFSLTERQKAKLDNELIIKGKGNKIIVNESDSREAIHTDAAALFENVNTLPDWLK